MKMPTSEQEEYIWLYHVDGRSYADIEKLLGVPRSILSQWEIELRPFWIQIAEVKKIHNAKKMTMPIKEFYNWYIEEEKKCEYCGISEPELKTLMDSGAVKTKRTRGRKLELDRKVPDGNYDDLDNIVFACYWCNNAKTDTFTHEEFKKVGVVISGIWKGRKEHVI